MSLLELQLTICLEAPIKVAFREAEGDWSNVTRYAMTSCRDRVDGRSTEQAVLKFEKSRQAIIKHTPPFPIMHTQAIHFLVAYHIWSMGCQTCAVHDSHTSANVCASRRERRIDGSDAKSIVAMPDQTLKRYVAEPDGSHNTQWLVEG